MWHYEKVKYYPYDPKTDFVQKKYYESVIPITTDSGKLPQNIIGTSFLVSYGKISYVITARHVLKGEKDPVIYLTNKNGEPYPLGTSTLGIFGVKWIHHPDGEDLSAIPIILPIKFDDRIFNKHLVQGTILEPSNIRNGAVVKHIGFGCKETGKNVKTGKRVGMPAGVFGVFDNGTRKEIRVRSPCFPGDSGSPLFLKRGNGITLLGILVKGKPMYKINPNERKVTGNTIIIPIHHIYKILNSKKMKEQVEDGMDNAKNLLKL